MDMERVLLHKAEETLRLERDKALMYYGRTFYEKYYFWLMHESTYKILKKFSYTYAFPFMVDVFTMTSTLYGIEIRIDNNLPWNHIELCKKEDNNMKQSNKYLSFATTADNHIHRSYKDYSLYYKRNESLIKNVIFNEPATIVYWNDNTKTVVKCGDDEAFDPEKGLAMAIAKRFLGDRDNYYEVFKKWLPKEEKNPKAAASYNSSGTKEVCKTKNRKMDLKSNDIYKTNEFVEMGVKEYAAYCGVSESTMRKRIKNGEVKSAVKVNGKWIIKVNLNKKADPNE